ncbi:MAG: CheR family methyltransferase [Trueperaceae bacterium]|nr:CheR family methyltransferase [Trueperaceae bacterium]
MGVILTGSGSDGSVGLGLIKEQGGLTLAQDPNEAEFAEMPRSAVATGQVDEVLPLSGIAQQISAYIDNRDRVEVPTREDALSGEDAEALEQIVDLLYEHASHDFSHYRRPTLLRRIRRRLQIRGTPTLSGYLDYLRLEPAEARILYHDLLITVTNFFRDPDAFAALKAEVIPKLFEGKGIGGQVRVWSIGCATGEEAYSLAILLHEHAATLRTPPALRVFATDVSQDVLDRARDGRYPREIVNDVSAERIERFFSIDEGGGYRVNRNVRETIVFSHHNLLADPPFSHLDLVVCRNMLIYLQRDLQRGIYELFHYALEPETFLFLGMSESVDENDLFQPVDKRHKIYRRQKVNAARPRLPTLPLQSPDNASRDRTASAAASSTKPPADPTGYGALHHQMVERYAPPSLLVDQDYDIVHYSENVGRYLRQPGGEPTDDVLQRVPASLRAGLRAALHAAFRKKEPTRSRPTPVDIEGQKRTVVFWVRPTDPVKKPPQSFALVIFDDSETRVTPDRSPTANPDGSQTERELEEELEVTRTRLDEVLEEYEISQEEMRAANEELQSMNEELKSTAEELETSKEELQSANEELVIANQENRHKVEELSAFADDLHNLLMATDIAIIFLDRDLRIKRFTPRAHDLFNILRVDLGRPLDHFTNRFGDDDVVSDAREVLRRLVPIEREITNDDRRDYLLRMLPYRTAEDRIDGVVISLVDITDLKQTERELQQLTAELEGRVEARTEQVRGLMSALSLAEQRERARIAQVLHDDVQQMLFALQMKFRQLQKNSPDSLAERYDDANDLLKQAFQMVRTLSVGLNPPLLKEEGLEAALRWVGEQMEETYDLTSL